MATIDDLDADISDLQSRITTLHAHRSNLASILLSQPHLAARLKTNNAASTTVQHAFEAQSKRNTENIYRACAGVTAYKVRDPDPHAINNGHILGVRIDVSVGASFVETYHVLFNWRGDRDPKVLKIHKHTIPPCIPLQHLANKWLPSTNAKDADAEPEQDLVRFGRLLRKELVAWHMRVQAVADMRREAGLSESQQTSNAATQEGPAAPATTHVLNAFVSSDEEDSDADNDDDARDPQRILDIEADTAVRQVTITWADQRTAVLSVSKDGRIEKAVCRGRDGVRDVKLCRAAVGPVRGLMRRLKE